MSLQKFRADTAGEKQRNGGTPWYSNWMGGPTLALVRDCPIKDTLLAPRTVYATDHPDTFFSIPAACRYQRRTIRGFISVDDNREYVFHVHSDEDVPRPHEATNREGLTYAEWLAAATFAALVPEDDRHRKAWRAGEDPTEFAAWANDQRAREILVALSDVAEATYEVLCKEAAANRQRRG